MVLNEGDKIFVAHRRLYAEDQSRFFTGVVEEYAEGMVRTTGYSWAKEPTLGAILRKADTRTKILSIVSGTLLVYKLPDTAHLEAMIISEEDGKLVLTDGIEFSMDLSDRPDG